MSILFVPSSFSDEIEKKKSLYGGKWKQKGSSSKISNDFLGIVHI
jgi:hypothetical protein